MKTEMMEGDGKGDVFIDPKTGEKFTPKRLTNLWNSIVKYKAGFESYCLFHDLRHTFASHHVINGTSLSVVQQLMGHARITQTMIYAHLAPDQTKEAMQNFKNGLKKDPVQIGQDISHWF